VHGPSAGGAGLGFALSFDEGRVALTVEGTRLPGLGRADRVELEIPGLSFPFDLSGGIAQFQNRRCRLRELALSVGAAEVTGFLRQGRLADHGIVEPAVTIAAAELHVEGQARLGRHQAGFTARGALRTQPAGRARISMYDVRVYGFLPVSAPLLASALFAACGAAPGRSAAPGGVPAAAPLVWLEGATDLGLELLELALLGLLPAQGWRMPERRQVEAVPAGGGEGRLALRYARSPAEEEGGTAGSSLAGYDRSRSRHAVAEAALARGEVGTATDAYRGAAPVAAGDPWASARLLQLLASRPSTAGEAAAVASQALARWPGFAPALLAQAATASLAGRCDEAAGLYQQLADLSANVGPIDQASALVAVARERDRAGDAAAARAALERARLAWPGHGGAWRALAQRLAAQGRWADLLGILVERAVDEPDPAAKAALYAEAGFVHLDRLAEEARARDRFEQAVCLAPGAPAGWEGLGRLQGEGGRELLERALAVYTAGGDRTGQARVQVALAGLDEAAADEATAVRRLEEAAGLDEEAALPLSRAAEIALRRGEHSEARRLLERALSRTADPEQRVGIARRLAQVLDGPLGQPVSARVLLELTLAEHPCDARLLDELAALLARAGSRDEWAVFLRRALAEARQPDQRRVVLVRLGALAREDGDHAQLSTILDQLAEMDGSEPAAAAPPPSGEPARTGPSTT
jgi:tetratricopeptide (TPR) repeat protein